MYYGEGRNGNRPTGNVSGGPLVPYILILKTQANIEHPHMSPRLFPESVQGTVAEL